jgi:hypothetical protein
VLGYYEHFPLNIHIVESFNSSLSNKKLQQKIIQVFYEVNRKEFSFEEVCNPTIPQGRVIFEFGLADAESFNFIDEEEVKKTLYLLAKEQLQNMDFFCGIRYYKIDADKKTALKFDYYLLRTIFNQNTVEIQVHHERGPRYISPDDLISFIFNKINEASKRKILKTSNP